MRWVLLGLLVFLGVSSGGWMAFDGFRRIITGDYVRIVRSALV